ncbi:MAG: zeta toxin family protein [Gammaproteobacteria bacterium]|nr:zeta toxin family protein [Gammaproteobacteria bacterium]
MSKPILVVVAGSNGSGKTTITEKLLKHSWSKDMVYINPDNIAQEKFGGWNDQASFIKAANHAEDLRQNCIKNKQNLSVDDVDPRLIFRVINKSNHQTIKQYQPLLNWTQIIYDSVEFNQ